MFTVSACGVVMVAGKICADDAGFVCKFVPWVAFEAIAVFTGGAKCGGQAIS